MGLSQPVPGASVQQAMPWIERLARVGYAAKGVVYILIGALAVMAIMGVGGKATNQQGAIATIAQEPFGVFLLVAIGVGLLGYALWRLLQAAYNPEHKNAIKRIGYVASGISYGYLGFLSLRAVSGERPAQAGSDAGQQQATSTLLQQPFGQLLVFVLAAILFAVAIGQLVNGAKAKFMDTLKTHRMSDEEQTTAKVSGRIGLIARGLVFIVIAWFLARAAMTENAKEAKGFAGALRQLLDAPFGPYLFGFVALGLIAYGIFMFVMAKYRRMAPVDARVGAVAR